MNQFKNWIRLCAVVVAGIFLLNACSTEGKKRVPGNFMYKSFKDSVLRQAHAIDTSRDTTNIFDGPVFTPGRDSLDILLDKIDTILRREEALMIQFDTMLKRLKTDQIFSVEEKMKIKDNLAAIDSFRRTKDSIPRPTCTQSDCLLFVEIIKSTQTLYLYLEGELKDSFKVSTGMKGYETPSMDLRPRGPIFTKYTSRKFPGGNYKGLGNMPYAVFVKGGYAIHGTTPGNFSKLGRVASHGCIRLHPDNAIIFNELVKLVGLENTWVVVKN